MLPRACQRLSRFDFKHLTDLSPTRSLKEIDPLRRIRRTEQEGMDMVGALIGLLIIVAIVLVLLKVAVAGGILGLIAIILLVLLLLGRI
jgi:hypothetical protein